jgi:alcohol dehydrogenase (cytochrome c)
MNRRVAVFLSLLILITTTLLAEDRAGNWPAYNRTPAGDRFSPLAEVTTANVRGLREICVAEIPDGRSFQSGPIAIDGTVYVTTDTGTFAIDGATCAVKWKHTHSYKPPSFLGSNRGAAYLDGRLFRGSGDGHVFAIDARNGAWLWDVAIGDPGKGESIPMAPLAWNGMVFVGNAGGDFFGVTGRVYALSAVDGHVLWQFDSVPKTAAVMATWPQASPENPPTGGAFWTTFSLDASKGVLYVSSGNPAPDFVIALRGGKNLYTNCIIALDARTGALRGYRQPVTDDFHDWDVSAAPALVTTKKGLHLTLAAGKDGYLHGIDRSLTSEKYRAATTTHVNTTEPLSESHATRFCPGTQGGSEWNGPAFNPALNAVFTGAVDWCTSVTLLPLAQLKGSAGAPWTGAEPPAPFGIQDAKETWGGWVTSFNADSGSVLWKFRAPTPIVGAITPTAGGVLFFGDLNGAIYAMNAATGERLWSGNAGQPVGGGIISYRAGGHQRIAVAAGMSSPIWPVKSAGARLVVFGLP